MMLMVPADFDPSGIEQPRTVLIFTAAAGGGHLAAARAVETAATEAGHHAIVIDGLETMSPRLRWLHIQLYAWLLEHLQWSWGFLFWLFAHRPMVWGSRRLIGHFWSARLREIIDRTEPDVIVSTYPTVTAGLGRLIQTHQLNMPVTALVTDYGVHPLWVSPFIDLHFVLSDDPKRQAELAGGRAEVMDYPVDARFLDLPSRKEARQMLGLPESAFICLIVGGAWGVGPLEDAAMQIADAGAFPLVVAGKNEKLRARLNVLLPNPSAARVLGWTDQMPLLMAASNYLVQNAGGVTCLEALRVGLPIVFYRPIPGHGLLNAKTMQSEQQAILVQDARSFGAIIQRGMRDPATIPVPPTRRGVPILSAILAQHGAEDRVPAARPSLAMRAGMAAAAIFLCLWFSFSLPAPTVAARMLGHPIVDQLATATESTIVVRVNDSRVASAIAAWSSSTKAPVAIVADLTAFREIDRQADLDLGIYLSTKDRRLLGSRWDWIELRRSISETMADAGDDSSWVLIRDGSLSLGSILTAPRGTEIVVLSPDSQLAQNSGIVFIDATNLSTTNALALMRATADRVCDHGRTCVSLPFTDISTELVGK